MKLAIHVSKLSVANPQVLNNPILHGLVNAVANQRMIIFNAPYIGG